ncbi:MAG: hypothetical protein QXU98_05150 [Candidatus Parvarchaeota archaeon]
MRGDEMVQKHSIYPVNVYIVFSRYTYYKNPPGHLHIIGVYNSYEKAGVALDEYIKENHISNFVDYEYGIAIEALR